MSIKPSNTLFLLPVLLLSGCNSYTLVQNNQACAGFREYSAEESQNLVAGVQTNADAGTPAGDQVVNSLGELHQMRDACRKMAVKEKENHEN